MLKTTKGDGKTYNDLSKNGKAKLLKTWGVTTKPKKKVKHRCSCLGVLIWLNSGKCYKGCGRKKES